MPRRPTPIAEAPRRKQAVVVPVLSAEQRAAQALSNTKRQAEALRVRALDVAKQAAQVDPSLNRGFDQAWVIELRSAVAARIKQAQADALESVDEDDPNAKPAAINRLDCTNESLGAFWDDRAAVVAWSDAEHNLRRYARAKPTIELSDDITRLRDEADMLSHTRLQGGFGSIGEMERTLGFIDSWAASVRDTLGEGWSDPSDATRTLILCGIPLIVFYCKLIAAIPDAS